MQNGFQGSLLQARLLFLICLLVGLGASLLAAYEFWQYQRIHNSFQPASCLIDQMKYEEPFFGSSYFTSRRTWPTEVEYHFQVGDQTYSGDFLSRESHVLEGQDEIDQFQNRYGVGISTTCYYNPANPTESILIRPGMGNAEFRLKIAGVFILVSILGFIGTEVLAGRTAQRSDRRRPLTWGPEQALDNDPLARTRQIYRQKLES